MKGKHERKKTSGTRDNEDEDIPVYRGKKIFPNNTVIPRCLYNCDSPYITWSLRIIGTNLRSSIEHEDPSDTCDVPAHLGPRGRFHRRCSINAIPEGWPLAREDAAVEGGD